MAPPRRGTTSMDVAAMDFSRSRLHTTNTASSSRHRRTKTTRSRSDAVEHAGQQKGKGAARSGAARGQKPHRRRRGSRPSEGLLPAQPSPPDHTRATTSQGDGGASPNEAAAPDTDTPRWRNGAAEAPPPPSLATPRGSSRASAAAGHPPLHSRASSRWPRAPRRAPPPPSRPAPRVASPSEATGGPSSRPPAPPPPLPFLPPPPACATGPCSRGVGGGGGLPFPARGAVARVVASRGGAPRSTVVPAAAAAPGGAAPGGLEVAARPLGGGLARWMVAAPSRPDLVPFGPHLGLGGPDSVSPAASPAGAEVARLVRGGCGDGDTSTAAQQRVLHEPLLGSAGPRGPGTLPLSRPVGDRRWRWRLSPPAWLLSLALVVPGCSLSSSSVSLR
nr:translation initiation factor IF-2-like [Aegilops tauschii subsp. strangulata]